MDLYGSHINRLIEELQGLPGIGQKTAQRLAFHIINMPAERVQSLADALLEARSKANHCKICCTVTDDEICPICRSEKRDHRQIMVVEDPRDLAAYERTGRYSGLYHVLHGAISPMLGIGPNEIKLKELMKRLQDQDGKSACDEVIIATNASVEGEATAMYILKLIRALDIDTKVTRIASGVPVGGDIENIDEVTLERALTGRVEL